MSSLAELYRRWKAQHADDPTLDDMLQKAVSDEARTQAAQTAWQSQLQAQAMAMGASVGGIGSAAGGRAVPGTWRQADNEAGSTRPVFTSQAVKSMRGGIGVYLLVGQFVAGGMKEEDAIAHAIALSHKIEDAMERIAKVNQKVSDAERAKSPHADLAEKSEEIQQAVKALAGQRALNAAGAFNPAPPFQPPHKPFRP